MQNVACPSCGAPVEFRSHAAVQAICGFCQATVVKDAESVKDLGRMSAVLEDYSPIQIGTSGKFEGKAFDVLGRIQLRYSAGMWNEWYVVFNDGSFGWLGDSSGLFTLTVEKPELAQTGLPAFDEIQIAQLYSIAGKAYTAAETRTGECIAGQGELPFAVGQGYQIKTADFRRGNVFFTLDYSDDVPKVYFGRAVTLEQMECQLLRDRDDIKSSAGKFKGRVGALDCPSCGSSIKYAPGVTSHLLCQACNSQIDAATPKAQVLAQGAAIEAVHTTLQLGAEANIDGSQHQIIGLMNRIDDEGTVWTEYLLYSARGGFLWLIETEEGWSRAKVQTDWPAWNGEAKVTMGGKPFERLYDYEAKVLYAVGAFNWRVEVGDRTRIVDFGQDKNRLAAEITEHEITWSYANPVPADQVKAWFGEDIAAEKSGSSTGGLSFKTFAIILLILNAIPVFFGHFSNWVILGLIVLAIYLPYWYLNNEKGSS
jgi:uncharacterized protein (DUF983 family)